MNLRDLDLFVATAEQGGLSAAARLLEISPAVASASLKRLEADLGTALFVLMWTWSRGSASLGRKA